MANNDSPARLAAPVNMMVEVDGVAELPVADALPRPVVEPVIVGAEPV